MTDNNLDSRRCLPPSRRNFLKSAATAALTARSAAAQSNARRRNVVFILSDDHRYDALGFMHPQPWLRTPHMDTLAREGALLKNAFVCTALCSPSRASILTGVYAHRHHIVDNNTAIPKGTRFFPQLLQRAGYKTAFIGKWHMGREGDDPQPGFDKWISFRGQGSYLPERNGLNIDGKHVAQKGYITDELTDYALDWLSARGERPFLLHLAHKAVHTDILPQAGAREGKLLVPGVEGHIGFVAAPRHAGRYAKEPFTPPESMAFTPRNFGDKPMWVQNRRNSRHGVDIAFGEPQDMAAIYRQYME